MSGEGELGAATEMRDMALDELEAELEGEGEVGEQAEEEEEPPPPGQDPLKLTPTIYNMVLSKVERTLVRRLAKKEGENPGLVAAEIRALIGDLKRPSEEAAAEEEKEEEKEEEEEEEEEDEEEEKLLLDVNTKGPY